MTTGRGKALFERRWRLAECLHASRAGRSIAGIMEAVGASRATVYRDLEFLRVVGVAITSEVVNGEARYRLLGEARPGLVPPLRRAALDVACEMLAPLKGTRLLGEIERLRRELPALRRGAVGVRAPRLPLDEAVLANIERATEGARLMSIVYRGARDAVARERRVLPLELRLAKGQLYVACHDLEVNAARTFKVARVLRATVGEPFERSAFARPETDGSVVVWTGRLLEVTIRLSAEVARLAVEYPLVEGQSLDAEASGAVVVRARVAGTEEVLRWVLAWGREAEVLGPVVLRERVAGELSAALSRYCGGAEEGVSRELRRGERKVLGAGGAEAAGRSSGGGAA